MENYRKNSEKANEEEQKSSGKKVEKVVKGSAKAKKKSELRKIADAFIQEDAHTVKDYIFDKVLIPAVKKTFSDIVTNALDMFLWGKGSDRRTRGSSERISYRRYFDEPSRGSRESERRTRSYEYDEIVLDSREEAIEVLNRMDELLSHYKMVSVADFYDLIGITGKTTDNHYGWTDLTKADVIRDRDGYLIKLPRAIALD